MSRSLREYVVDGLGGRRRCQVPDQSRRLFAATDCGQRKPDKEAMTRGKAGVRGAESEVRGEKLGSKQKAVGSEDSGI
jgi:hypothetical protein